MSTKAIFEAVDLGNRMEHVFVTTTNGNGLPHLAAAGIIRYISEDHISVEAWFCPATIQNLGDNPLISVVAWDPATDIGHQILGEVEKVEEIAMMDGFTGDLESEEQLPQSESRLIIRVDQVLAFSHAPHSDTVE
ncbi:pyridoxamine 5'-phosphate oxidase family protein [Desulfopila inferna]|uniref:pyridoxamine 5'-phosphate oxidase family protein n=1 Tax=Desulfopila inferna TaxID=468528 RepID=UPI0019658268|nr:pyridoxamine 5'-phosphate oxidase family protein [Desulfopila inferna]MBM9605580.1 pyridoxamine 5'-phosphate oxidase family protein [Desulfopila inferna]